MSRRLLASLVLASVAAAGPATAQQQAPEREPVTGFAFPPRIGEAKRVHSVDYAQATGKPQLGYLWSYQTPRLLAATIQIFGQDNENLPDGPMGAAIDVQFQQAMREIEQRAQLRGIARLKPMRGPGPCTVVLAFRCVVLSGIEAPTMRPAYTELLLTARRGRFVRIRLDWVEGVADQPEVDRFARLLVEAMRR